MSRSAHSLFNGIRWMNVKNVGGTTIPAYGLMRVTGREATGEYQVQQPNTDSQAGCLVAGPWDIPASEYGQALDDFPFPVLYDTADGTPAAGEAWGPGNGSYKLRKGKTGYLIYGNPINGAVDVTKVGSGSSAATFSGCRVAGATAFPTLLFGSGANVITFDQSSTSNEQQWDTDSYHSYSTNKDRVTTPFVGKYDVGAFVRFATPSSATAKQLGLHINLYTSGGSLVGVPAKSLLWIPTNGSDMWLTCSGVIDAPSAGYYITLSVLGDSSVSIAMAAMWMTKRP